VGDTSAEEWARSAARLSYIDGEAFNAWLDSVKAQAWDEGQKSGARWGGPPLDAYESDPPSSNPYREQEA
jgi:hypothetical protein